MQNRKAGAVIAPALLKLHHHHKRSGCNQNTTDEDYGAAIYADNSVVYLSKCTFDGNGVADESKNIYGTTSVVHAEDSTLTMEKVTFTNKSNWYLC